MGRVKLRSFEGDIPRKQKIHLIEKGGLEIHPWHAVTDKAAKNYRKMHERLANKRERITGKREGRIS